MITLLLTLAVALPAAADTTTLTATADNVGIVPVDIRGIPIPLPVFDQSVGGFAEANLSINPEAAAGDIYIWVDENGTVDASGGSDIPVLRYETGDNFLSGSASWSPTTRLRRRGISGA